MKKSLCALFLSAFLVTCGQNTGTSVETGFKVTAGSLTANTIGLTSVDLDFRGSTLSCTGAPTTQCYAVITTSTVNSVSYVAIAVQDNPSSPMFNLKIYFQATEIPASKNMTDTDVVVKFGNPPATQFQPISGTLVFNFNSLDNTYTITLPGGANFFEGGSFQITNLKAQKY
jgi:hypothetical protein